MYLVAAISERPGPPAVEVRRGWRPITTSQPVGTQHATARIIGLPEPGVALCGEDLAGWVVFSLLPFDPGHSASCQRCAQLASSAGGGPRLR